MSRPPLSNRLVDLSRLLDALSDLHDGLLTLIKEKIAAMKRSDVTRMQTLAEQERDFVQQIHSREGCRRQLMDAIGKELGLSPQAARALPLSRLTARFPDAQRPTVLNAAERLRGSMVRVAAANRVAGAVARQMTHHLQGVLASVRPRGDTPAGYAGRGTAGSPWETRILDAVG